MMQHAVRYMETHSQNPYYNLAFEEYVLTHRTEGDYLLLWQNDNTIVHPTLELAKSFLRFLFARSLPFPVVHKSTIKQISKGLGMRAGE